MQRDSCDIPELYVNDSPVEVELRHKYYEGIDREVTLVQEAEEAEEIKEDENVIIQNSIIEYVQSSEIEITENVINESKVEERNSHLDSTKMEDSKLKIYSNSFRHSVDSIVKNGYFYSNESERIRELEELLQQSRENCTNLNEKLIAEMEKRASLQHEKDSLSNEIEELTRQLFEEANGMVANEAKERFKMSKKVEKLQAELEGVRERLKEESAQLIELKEKMKQESVQERRISHHDKKPVSFSMLLKPGGYADMDWEVIFGSLNAELYEEFIDYSEQISSDEKGVKSNHPFMKRCLLEDVEGCLEFKTKTKMYVRKVIIESLLYNQCLIQEEREAVEDYDDSVMASSASLPEFFGSALLRSEGKKRCSLCGHLLSSSSSLYKCIFNQSSSFLLDVESSLTIDRLCRDRLVAVADFFSFLRLLKGGHYGKRSKLDLFLEMLQLRRQMFYYKVGGTVFYIHNDSLTLRAEQ